MAGTSDFRDPNPYEPPRSICGPDPLGPDRPPWPYVAFDSYCGLVALVYGGIGFFVAADARFGLLVDPAERPDAELLPWVSALSLTVSAAFAAGPLLPRRPWAWTFGLILILVGLPLTWPFAASWFGRATRFYFERPTYRALAILSESLHASRPPARLPGLGRGRRPGRRPD